MVDAWAPSRYPSSSGTGFRGSRSVPFQPLLCSSHCSPSPHPNVSLIHAGKSHHEVTSRTVLVFWLKSTLLSTAPCPQGSRPPLLQPMARMPAQHGRFRLNLQDAYSPSPCSVPESPKKLAFVCLLFLPQPERRLLEGRDFPMCGHLIPPSTQDRARHRAGPQETEQRPADAADVSWWLERFPGVRPAQSSFWLTAGC